MSAKLKASDRARCTCWDEPGTTECPVCSNIDMSKTTPKPASAAAVKAAEEIDNIIFPEENSYPDTKRMAEIIDRHIAPLVRVKEAAENYRLYLPGSSRGGGQAMTTLSCGHVGQVGRKVCQGCALRDLRSALDALGKEGE